MHLPLDAGEAGGVGLVLAHHYDFITGVCLHVGVRYLDHGGICNNDNRFKVTIECSNH